MEVSLNRKTHLKSGFTFIEIIIAVAIIGILALIVGPSVLRYRTQAQLNATATNAKVLKRATDSYFLAVGKYPSKLEDLLKKPADVPLKKWIAPFLDVSEIPMDSWGNPFAYKLNAKSDNHPYDLYSWGPTGPGSAPDEWIDAWA